MISIAMATYNGARYIRQQIDSILKQSIQDFELIINDDCSTDNTWDIVNEYAKHDERIRAYRNERNVGFKRNFESVISLCRGDYIALSDQDDIWHPLHLEVLLNNIGNKMIACADAVLVDYNGIDMGMLLSYQESLDYVPEDDLLKAYSVIFFRSPYQGSSMLIKKTFFDVALPIPEKIEYHDAWFSELGCFYGGISYVNTPLSYYRRHDKNVTGNKIARRPKLRTFIRHIRHSYFLSDRQYIIKAIMERCPSLNNAQLSFLHKAHRYHSRKATMHGRIINAFFDLWHYRHIFSCYKSFV